MLAVSKVSFGNNSTNKSSHTPKNYKKIDKFVSRSAQPEQGEFLWLKNKGVNDVINFRTMYDPAITFDEAEYLKKLHINYHPIPTGTRSISEDSVQKFFNIVKEIRNSNGEKKLHLHCKAGADRTGFFSLLYKTLYKIDSFENNSKEMVEMGHNQKLYPNLINYAKEIVKKISTLVS